MRAPPDLGDGRFRIERAIGDGAVATVWRALDVESNAAVAIKVLRSEGVDLEDVQRLAQEAEILRVLDHPCIVRVLGRGVTRDGSPFVAMEWVDGIDLRTKLDRARRLPPADVRDIVGQICSALGDAHEHGVIHRDVKPENVLLLAPEHVAVKVVDFGMAKVTTPGAAKLTIDNKIFGTPQYMSPERARGRPVGAASDVYGVAVMTYEMLTGRRPFDAASPVVVLTQHLKAAPPPMQGVGREIEQAVLAGLAKDPAARPSARAFARRLGEAMAGGGA
jgi:serine/threonine-protein kinase